MERENEALPSSFETVDPRSAERVMENPIETPALQTASLLGYQLAEDTTIPPDFPAQEGYRAGHGAGEDSVTHRQGAQAQMR